jgi:hypothetical protein
MTARHQWLTSVILAAQEAEIRSVKVQTQPGQIVRKTLSWKNPSQKKAGGVGQGEGPETKPQYKKRKPKNISYAICMPQAIPSQVPNALGGTGHHKTVTTQKSQGWDGGGSRKVVRTRLRA